MGSDGAHAGGAGPAVGLSLPPQGWTDAPGARRVLAALDAREGATRMVGGAVRDALLGLPGADIDLATQLTPTELLARMQEAGVHAVPTGIEHGTVTAVFGDERYEVTTLRRDVATDGRRATVAFTRDWREDARRRDFTINALYADPHTGELFDYHDGLADLAAGRVRFIGSPLARIAEDHLRILRFFRFHARFGAGEPDRDGLAACAERANDLMALSRERVRDELLKLLVAPGVLATLGIMLEAGVLAPVLPEVERGRLAELEALLAREAALGEAPAPLRRLASLLPPDAALLDGVGARLRLSNAERQRLVTTADRLSSLPDSAAALAYRVGAESARDLILLRGGPLERLAVLLAELEAWQRPRLPITGGDLIALGVPPGPEVSRTLRQVEERWIEAGFPHGREAALAIARALRG